MNLARFESVSQASTVDNLRDAFASLANHLDFGLWVMMLVHEQPSGPAIYRVLSNVPDAFKEASQSMDDSRRDPVLKRLRATTTPFLYDQNTYTKDSSGDLWEIQAQFGYHTGVATALHLPHGKHLVVSIDRDRPLPRSESKLVKLLGDIQLLAAHAQDAALRLLPASPVIAGEGRQLHLTPRQREILGWIKRSKTDWEIAQILGLSEHTVHFHVVQILKVFECHSRNAAVIKAVHLGML